MAQKTKHWTDDLFGPNRSINWELYFRAREADRNGDQLYEMNKALEQRGILVLRSKGGKFGIINDKYDICQSSVLNGYAALGLYFKFRSDVFEYLASAKKHGFCKKDSFVFKIACNGKEGEG